MDDVKHQNHHSNDIKGCGGGLCYVMLEAFVTCMAALEACDGTTWQVSSSRGERLRWERSITTTVITELPRPARQG